MGCWCEQLGVQRLFSGHHTAIFNDLDLVYAWWTIASPKNSPLLFCLRGPLARNCIVAQSPLL
jgi:hypothetical protein